MASKTKKTNDEKTELDHGTSHYLGKLNRLYSEQWSQTQVNFENLDDDAKVDLVAEVLRMLDQADNSPIPKFEKTVSSKLRTDKTLVREVIHLMEESKLVSKATGKIKLTSSGKDVLK